jgi:hypothetical protein
MLVRELFAKLGLQVDEQSFTAGNAAIEITKGALRGIGQLALEAAEKFIGLVKRTAEMGHEIERTAQVVGLSTDELQRLRNATGLVGVETETLDRGLRLLARSMYAAKAGGADQADAFHKIGVKTREADGRLRSTAGVFADIADHFKTMPEGAEKVALAMKLLGRGGAALIPVLNQGSKEIDKLGRSAYIMSEAELKASADLVRAEKEWSYATRSLMLSVIGPLLPMVTSVVRTFMDWSKVLRELAHGTLAFFRKNWVATIAVISVVAIALIATNAALVASFVAVQIAAVGAAVAAAAAWIVAALPIIAIMAAVAALLVALDDLRGFIAGEDSLIGRYFDKIFGKGASTEFISFVKDAWAAVGEAVHEVYDWVVKFLEKSEQVAASVIKWLPVVMLYKAGKARFGKLTAGMTNPADREFGPAPERGGAFGELLARARQRAEGPAFGHQLPPDYVAPPSAGRDILAPTNNVQFHITQQPGQDPTALVEPIRRMWDDWWDSKMEAAGAATGH